MTSKKRQGFTLVEVLIGMSLMSLMMLVLFASLRICVQNWNAGEKKIAEVSQIAIVQNFFRNKLQTAFPLNAFFLEEKKFSFQGDEHEMQFVAAMPASAGRLGLQMFTMRLQKSKKGKGSELLVDIKPFFPQADEGEWENEEVVILKNVEDIRFGYYGSDGFIRESDWQEEWLDKSILPKLVSMDITLTNGKIWPQVIVALRINAVGQGISQGRGRNPFGIAGGKFAD